MLVCWSVCMSVTNFSQNLFFSFFWNSVPQYRFRKGRKWQKWVFQNIFWVFVKFCYYFLLEVACNEKHNLQFFWENTMSGKILVHELWAKMLLSNQNAGFFDQEYLWTICINFFDFVLWRYSPKKKQHLRILFLMRCNKVCPSLCRVSTFSRGPFG